MYLKFEKNKIRFRVSQTEVMILLKDGSMADCIALPDGSTFIYRIEVIEAEQNSADYIDGVLSLKMTRLSVEYLAKSPTKNGILFLQTGACYIFEVDLHKPKKAR